MCRRSMTRGKYECLPHLGLLLCIGLIPWPCGGQQVFAGPAASQAPYPHSAVIDHISWDWKTLRTAAPGSDLWPVTWAADGSLYTAWGDGGGFGGTDQDGRVALGFARIDGTPEHFTGVNLNGGKNPRHPASFPKLGKVGGLVAVGNRVYGWLNTQQGRWPNVDHALIWSDDGCLSWKKSDWVFQKGDGRFKPSTFLNFGRGLSGVPANCAGYVYFYGQHEGHSMQTFLGRAPADKLPDRAQYEFLSAMNKDRPAWSSDVHKAIPVFTDARSNGDLAGVVYIPAMKRYLLSSFHNGPGQLGIFDAPTPWGPWTTVSYDEHWGQMGSAGEGLTCSFPAKWISEDGRTLSCVFSAYGGSAHQGINAHDQFNLVKATLTLKQ